MASAKDTVIGIGIIGATGFIATAYRREIRQTPGARIVALCAKRQTLLEQAASEDGADVATADWRAVIEHPDVDLVVVATPDALHHEAVMACAAAGKHVVCEKPVAINANESRTMLAAYRARPHLVHFVPFWGRYLDVFGRARELVSQGLLGDTRSVICRWFNPRPKTFPFTWRDHPTLSAAGVIADDGSHFYDMIRWILDKEATRVLAQAGTVTAAKPDLGHINLTEALSLGAPAQVDVALRKGGTADFANVAWEYADGATGMFLMSHATHMRNGFAPELELHGTDASLSVDRRSGSLFLVRDDEPPILLEKHSTDRGNRFSRHVLPAILSTLAGESSDHPSLEDGHRVQIFTDAAAKAAELGQWVDLTSSGEG